MTSGRTTTQQILVQGMTSVMTVGIFANAMGMMVAAAGVEAMPAGLKGAKPTLAGINDLKSAYGSSIVSTAINHVGSGDIVTLAREVERVYIGDMRKKYGDWETSEALEHAPAGDVRAAREIAATLSQKGVTQASTPEKKEKALSVGKKRGGRKVAQPVKDTTTGIVYQSKAKAGMAVATEYDLDPKNHFIWYEVIKKDPKRVVRA